MTSFKVAGLPIKAELKRRDSWQVRKKVLRNGVVFVVHRERVGLWEARNVWAVREDFLSIKNESDALDFFRLHGPFAIPPEDATAQRVSTEVTLSVVHRYQAWLRHFIEEASPEWCEPKSSDMTTAEGAEAFSRELSRSSEAPTFTLRMGHITRKVGLKVPSPFLYFEAVDVKKAVYGSIYLDKMRGLRGAVCQREGCSNTFLTTDPRKRFCDDKSCGAALRMRNKRAADRMEKQKRAHL